MTTTSEIVILSGKGGTGKTSITAAFASLADNAVFTDCDVDAADLHLILQPEIISEESFPGGSKAEINNAKCTSCGLCMELCRFDAIIMNNGRYTIDEFTCEGCGLCVEACPEKAITKSENNNNNIYFAKSRFGPMVYGILGIGEENSGRLVSKVRKHAMNIALNNNIPLVLNDGPPGIGCPVISSVTGSKMVIAVTEPTLSGWHDLERLLELIGRFKTDIFVIINKYDLNPEMTVKIESGLKLRDINSFGKIAYDESFIHAMIQGKAINEYEPESATSKNLENIWKTIINMIYESQCIRKD